MCQQNREAQIGQNALGGSAKDEVAHTGMAEAAHRQNLRALGKRRVLKCRCDASAVQRQVVSFCVISSHIQRRGKGLREAGPARCSADFFHAVQR